MSAISRSIVAMLSGLLLSLCGLSVMAQQTYPVRPIRLVVPYPPGGIGDTFARALGQQLSDKLGKP